MYLIGHVFDMDWSQVISSVVGVLVVLTIPIGWGIKFMLNVDKRTTILETKGKEEGKKLDTINSKTSDIVDDVHIIKVTIAKIETVLESKSDDSVAGR